MSRILCVLALIAATMVSAQAQSLEELAQFAQSICGDIPEGSLTRTSIQGKVGANAGMLAKIVSGDANVSGSRTEEIYKGIPFDRLPDKIPTVSMCKIELIKVITSRPQSSQSKPVVVFTVCSGEYERACRSSYDAYLYCYSDVRAWAAARCESAVVTRVNTYGGNKCGYSIDKVTCTNPR